MDIAQRLTPFSQSILQPAMAAALRRTAATIGLGDFTVSTTDIVTPNGVNDLLVDLTADLWGASPGAVGRLLGVTRPASSGRDKARRGIKASQQVVGDFPQVYGRLRRWSDGVFDYEWSQAQLLQVMEEIEPMVIEALFWLNAATVAAVGSYAHLSNLIARFEKDKVRANALMLGLASGLETPDGRLIEALAVGIAPERLREEFGHLAVSAEGEMALPRLGEEPQALLGEDLPPEPLRWDILQAQERRKEAVKAAVARSGLLGRSGLKKAIALTQSTLVTQAKTRDALAYVLAATRHWAQAAAAEGMSDGRIQHPREIFMLEIEEIKQMVTGEWHSRDHVAPLIAGRKAAYEAAASGLKDNVLALGVAGETAEGLLLPLSAPGTLPPRPSGFIVLSRTWRPGWWRLILMAEGIIAVNGHLLSWAASVARAGDLPALMGGAACTAWEPGTPILLDPSRNRVEKVN